MKELELNVGARVYCRDGKCGKLAALVAGGPDWTLSHIVVEQGFLDRQYRLLPISLVEQATTGDVYLGVDDIELARFPEYQPDHAPALSTIGSGEAWQPELLLI